MAVDRISRYIFVMDVVGKSFSIRCINMDTQTMSTLATDTCIITPSKTIPPLDFPDFILPLAKDHAMHMTDLSVRD